VLEGEAAADVVRFRLAPRTWDIVSGQAHNLRPSAVVKIALYLTAFGLAMGDSELGLWRILVLLFAATLGYVMLFAVPHDRAAKVRKLKATMSICEPDPLGLVPRSACHSAACHLRANRPQGR